MKSRSLTQDEREQAGRALINWFGSQQITMEDATIIMAELLASMIHARAVITGGDVTTGLDIISLMIRTAKPKPVDLKGGGATR